jgi:hypothetical protein
MRAWDGPLRGGVDEVLEGGDGLEEPGGDELEVAVAEAIEEVEGEQVGVHHGDGALAPKESEDPGQGEDGNVPHMLQERVHRACQDNSGPA